MQKSILKPRSFKFSLDVIKFIDGLNSKDLTVQIISRQLIRSSTSIGANIIEGQAGSSRKDFSNFYRHALKSANETKYWLLLLKNSEKSDSEKTDTLISEVDELCNMLAASILTLQEGHR